MRACWLVVVVLGAACGDNADPAGACHLGTTQSAASVQDRRIIGEAAPYAP